MKEMITAITNFPIIIQGALGSALFAILFFTGKLLIQFVTYKYKETKDIGIFWAILAHEKQGEESNKGFLFCIYGAMHYILKALIFYIMALLTRSFIYIICFQ